MAYGPLCQCSFMSGPPTFQKKAPPLKQDRVLWDSAPTFEPPAKCEAPAPGLYTLYAFDIDEAKNDPKYCSRMMSLNGVKCAIFGSSIEKEGQIYDGHKSVREVHAALYHAQGRWSLKGINGVTYLESMTTHPYLRDSDGRVPKRYTSNNIRKCELIEPMDPKRRPTLEMSVIRLGDSNRRFWISGPLPLGDGEVEEAPHDPLRDRKLRKDRHDTSRHETRDTRDRDRSRSRRRRR